jgi:TolA-binding protein
MSPRLHNTFRAVAAAAVLAFAPQVLVPALAQDVDLEMRIQRLESQLRQLTGQNEELQYRNRQLEERLRQLGAAPTPAPGQQPPAPVQPNVAAAPQANAGYRQPAYPQQGGYPPPQPGYQQPAYPQQQGAVEPQIAAPAPIVQEPAQPGVGNRLRGDAFDPTQNPNAPGAPKALGGGQMPLSSQAAVGVPGGRGPGEPLDLGSVSPRPPGAPAAPAQPPTAALATLPPSATPRDEFDLGIGYMQRKDYALAEETMKNFVSWA